MTSAQTEPRAAEITFACQECAQIITFPAERGGHVEECPQCGGFVDVPYQSDGSLRKTASASCQSGAEEAAETVMPHSRTSAQLWLEIAAVLCLAYFPGLYAAIAVVVEPRASYSFANETMYRIVAAMQVSMPLLVILALGRDPWRVFGIVSPKWITDALVGGLVLLSGIIVADLCRCMLPPVMLEKWAFLHHAQRILPKLNFRRFQAA